MAKQDEQKMAALVKKLSAKAEQQKKPMARRKYDPTLVTDLDDDSERRAFFSDMKKREF